MQTKLATMSLVAESAPASEQPVRYSYRGTSSKSAVIGD